ncbi:MULTISPECIES: MGMT family protein [Prosthecochloris]|uniref:6-O-methylguanine DNA methyltransferase n=1 Tax=Prosthecochloris marina TaxID=2017681 RepID=A0A317T665_9CHLB|nr:MULTISPECIES: MGMT family protein [Prosthecochloris]PWW81227.1 6-O-methylguanine DNA methyltransferase [Prosthecochloris marina]UZJ37574.1 MGMT family protein [Prosthecochloris sp. SCSIO W1103]UZJ39393.1 MGMT family protein [Prosthecochloris sp. SCSIO W1102]
MTTEKTFYEQVYDLVRQIPEGYVSTYGIIAEQISLRSAARMVGWALNNANIATVPAHRVVNRNGELTGKGHFFTPDTMRQMLETEGVTFRPDGSVDLDRHLFRFSHS